jgi:foldase protein PrsA
VVNLKVPNLKIGSIPKKAKIAIIVLLGLAVLFFGRSLFVAAIVNGTPIGRLSVLKQLEEQAGGDVLTSLIERSLIFQEAKKQGVKITQEDIATQISSIEEILKAQELTLEDALSARGQTKADLEDQIKIQKTVEAILGGKINISDEDIKNYFEENKDLLEEGATLEEVTEEIKAQLYQQKLNEEYSKWIEELKAKAKIFYFVNYL